VFPWGLPEQLCGPESPNSARTGIFIIQQEGRNGGRRVCWFVGIDVSKATLDVAEGHDGDFFQTKNNPKGIQVLVERLEALAPALIVLESTGGYELRAASALYAAGLPVAVVNPGRVREFARSIGQLAEMAVA